MKKRYVGKERPPEAEEFSADEPDRFRYLDAIFDPKRITLDLAWEVLETGPMPSLDECRAAMTMLMNRHSSDSPFDRKHRSRVKTAYTYCLSKYSR